MILQPPGYPYMGQPVSPPRPDPPAGYSPYDVPRYAGGAGGAAPGQTGAGGPGPGAGIGLR